jgi:hypothetical protein
MAPQPAAKPAPDTTLEAKKEEHDLLHSFCLYPKVTFESQGQNEQVILVLRAHPVTQLGWIFNTFAFLFILSVVDVFLPQFLTSPQILYFNIFLLVMIFSYGWLNFLLWFFNVGIITNERIIDIDYYNVLYKEVSTTRLFKVEEVTTKSGGYLASLFDYGDVFVQTAGEEVNIEFKKIPHPTRVTEIINDLVQHD